ncbi:methionine adenosyltransferase [Persicirhabdus sediminis]|uniref:S-adenosylmethionine synthase n=1 Tax=Persicirhabdus sediminis TaxID=454144 RepID=A0A8J7SH28_9BACT|nr:methionine adenosyltransferase [Persicirhabdus sediminis]
MSYIFSSESVTEGHPDKVCDTISDYILDRCLEGDPNSRVACETLVKDNMVVLAGEISTNSDFNYQTAVYEAIKEIGYVHDGCAFHADRFVFINALGQQSGDIAQGVDDKGAEGKAHEEQGAGDQGLMFGYASNETPQLMPAPVTYAHQLAQEVTRLRKDGELNWLRPDAKTQVSCRYEDDKVTEVTAVVISTMHTEDVSHEEISSTLKAKVIDKIIPAELLNESTEILINPTGKFVIGGPEGDCGLTGRKIIVDTYGGMGRHGGGAFSGKDPSKVDRSAAYMCRWVAKNIVAAELANKVEIQVAYAIGHPTPVSISVDTFGTAKVDEEKIVEAVKKVFSFKPADIVAQLDLLRPIYSKTTNYGHFGREDADLPWEEINKVDELKQAVAELQLASV